MAARNVWLCGSLTNSAPYKVTRILGAGKFGIVMATQRIDATAVPEKPFRAVFKIFCPTLEVSEDKTCYLKDVVRDYQFVGSEAIALSHDLKEEVTPSAHAIISYNTKTYEFRIHQGDSVDFEEDDIIYAIINTYNPDAKDASDFFSADNSAKFIKPFRKRLFMSLKAFHNEGIAHKDIKPATLLVKNDTSDGISCQLIDLGSATTITQKDDHEFPGLPIITLGYAPPEAISFFRNSGKPYDLFAADVWAAGVSLLESIEQSTWPHNLKMGKKLVIQFRNDDHCKNGKHFTKFLETSTHSYNQDHAHKAKTVLNLLNSQLDLADLLDKIFVPEERRITAAQATEHPFFNSAAAQTPATPPQASLVQTAPVTWMGNPQRGSHLT